MSRFNATLGIVLLMLPAASAQTSAPATPQAKTAGKSRLPLVDELRQSYKGASLVVQQKGIMGLPIANLTVAVSNFENGALKQPGWSDRVLNAERAAWFQPGDRVIAEKFDVDPKHDRITFTLVTPDRAFKAGLHFKFSKGFLEQADAGRVYDMIGQVIVFAPAGNETADQGGPPPPAAPAPPQPAQPAAAPPAAPEPAQSAAPAPSGSVAPLMLNGQVIGYGPVGAVLLPPDQPPSGADARAWIPVMRDGKVAAYAPPGSVIFGAASSSQAAPAEPQTIKLGQTGEEVQAILGPPDKIANLGSKVIFVYKDLKVTLTDGKVTDVQ